MRFFACLLSALILLPGCRSNRMAVELTERDRLESIDRSIDGVDQARLLQQTALAYENQITQYLVSQPEINDCELRVSCFEGRCLGIPSIEDQWYICTARLSLSSEITPHAISVLIRDALDQVGLCIDNQFSVSDSHANQDVREEQDLDVIVSGFSAGLDELWVRPKNRSAAPRSSPFGPVSP